MLRISFQEIFDQLERVLLKMNFDPERAALCARLFAETSCDGVYSHGVNRFGRFVKMIQNGAISVSAAPELVHSFGALERWDGRQGAGNLNAYQSMNRAIELADQNGIGCIALSNTNHWMRGGSYGWQAAERGVIGICWTNTLANLPAWGARQARLGNNPLVIAVPRSPNHVVLDMAMSQFSYGALDSYETRGEQLLVDGGFDAKGQLTRDPSAIKQIGRVLPIGFWKGSGLSLTLDMIAAMLSGGRATHQIELDPERETKISQIFIAINLPSLDQTGEAAPLANQIIEHLQMPDEDNAKGVRYPGERTLQTRTDNLKNGIPVEEKIWSEIQTM